MGMADELERLSRLHAQGALSDAEYAQAKARVLAGESGGSAPGVEALARFRRSTRDRWLGGVCGGLAQSTGVESWIWRLVGVCLALMFGSGVLLYILLWIFVPEDN